MLRSEPVPFALVVTVVVTGLAIGGATQPGVGTSVGTATGVDATTPVDPVTSHDVPAFVDPGPPGADRRARAATEPFPAPGSVRRSIGLESGDPPVAGVGPTSAPVPGPAPPPEPTIEPEYGPSPVAATNASGPAIVELYPNPVAAGNPGEFVLVRFPEPTNVTGWRLVDDGRQSARLPDRTVEGTVAFAVDPANASRHTDYEVHPLTGHLQLAVDGEHLELRTAEGVAVDAAGYDRAPEAERYVRTDDGWTWRPLGSTAFEPVTVDGTEATAFVLPDAPAVAERELRAADERLLLAGYTLTSDRVVDALLDAHRDGIEVAVLLEGRPVGGMSDAQVVALDRLVDAGVPVTVLGGDHARYRNHHAKYAVIDDRAIVTTENWKPSGIGGGSSRGWGIVLDDPAVAEELAAVFEADRSFRDGVAWERYRRGVDPVDADPSRDEYRSAFAPEAVTVERAQVLVTPDNARPELASLLRSADESIRIKQVRIGPDDPLLAAAIDAARRGVEVEILLASAWYVAEENRELAADLDALAAEEDLDLTVELVEPRSRFETVHAKGAIVDDRHVVLGSLNWNPTALEDNREVVTVLTGDEVADYYGDVFRADRRGGRWRLPVGTGLALGSAWLVVGVGVARRLEWA